MVRVHLATSEWGMVPIDLPHGHIEDGAAIFRLG